MPSCAASGRRTNAAANAEPRLRSSGTLIEACRGITVLMSARAADELETN
jgi:hypothetical protein